jgi:hypothetical protein
MSGGAQRHAASDVLLAVSRERRLRVLDGGGRLVLTDSTAGR